MAVMFIAACSTKNEVPENPEPPKDSWYLYGWHESYPDEPDEEGVYFKIDYTPDSLIKKITSYAGKFATGTSTGISEATYQDELLISYVSYNGSQATAPAFKSDMEYKDGRLIRSVHYANYWSDGLVFHHIDSFFYDNAGRLTSSIRSQLGMRDLSEFTWVDDNVTEIKLYRLSEPGRQLLWHDKFEYYPQENFFRNHPLSIFRRMTTSVPYVDILSASRQLCKMRYSMNRVSKDSLHWQYTFNEDGLPLTERTIDQAEIGGSLHVVRTDNRFEFRKLGQ